MSQIKRMDMEARSLSQDKSRQLLSKVGADPAARAAARCQRAGTALGICCSRRVPRCRIRVTWHGWRACDCLLSPNDCSHVAPVCLQVKEYKADLASLKEQLKQAATGASESDAARAELGLGDNYYSTSGRGGGSCRSCGPELCVAAALVCQM